MHKMSCGHLYFILALMCFLSTSCYGMICYRCTILPRQYDGDADQQCSKFDGSSKFYQDCPTSTFCMKHIIQYKYYNKTMTTVERDCAPQKNSYQDYNFEERKWHSKETIDTEAYKDGCFLGKDKGTPNGPSEYCYCSSDYCNHSALLSKPFLPIAFLVIVVLQFL